MDLTHLNVRSQGSLRLPRRRWLLYHADVFHLRSPLFSNFWTLHLWSRLSARSLSPSPLLFTLSIDTTPFLCHCVSQEEDWVCLQLQPSHKNPSSSVAFDFFQMCHVLTSTFLHILLPNSQVALCSFLSLLLWFRCGAWTLVHVAPVVLSFFLSFFLTFLFGGSSSLSVILLLLYHLYLQVIVRGLISHQHCLNTWAFFTPDFRASHNLHCGEKIYWYFKVLLWRLMELFPHKWNNKTLFFLWLCTIQHLWILLCVCVCVLGRWGYL